ncbi:ornithine carbamoyltransferase [Candidatus Endoriftia persephone]|jgi:ornithine carbamoyltransferase|uniref:Ornithine carbamoyltransferase n=3 Tax=Gammaproteobacteria TaxID=1236 RepID=G2FJI7_9GAMM|nr:ornithine carbamoyltransferase [Candidatus Endoriftia persephone]EGV50490.1 ornithine carbamoyltransferase [endosymbiont of Riftia pachyptila (vent Ph05)]EGW53047.1 ornithine carbamoyltransferase [endosymbiont of Tevnia jerichonana (vent Tica)]USF87076.1 ornithine carbamoyltransferase [Candidatus Endoriftia persephone]
MNDTQPRHFLSLLDLSSQELTDLIDRAIELKRMTHASEIHAPLKQKNLGMVFEKSSTRTRISFEVGMTQLGGHALFLSPRDTQLGRGEPIEDSARVMSRMVDIIMIRTFEQEKLERFAEYSQVPVINALTDLYHPCQLLADMQTYVEHRGSIQGKTVAWIGDGNNMCHSYINAARQFDFQLSIACPEGYDPDNQILTAAGDRCRVTRDPMAAAKAADLVVTDVWASMGQEEEQQQREKAFSDFKVDEAMMAIANPDALFMHCLPAHRGEEVSAAVIDAPDSVVWDEAENRLHSQKALLEFLLLSKQK